ncbi:hypothetical protein IAE16_02090 [Hydrogenobacter sp. T-2]|uniref:hypothetical protein n=1 Tax=Pampinifervens diazotrophicum TaxID=1632018 RepID=UPI002B25A014|nr:hypothetical protein [Hydrogenobacter sp. T-2]WPM32477.1 hypothetical protein IAE16_02090 [Hydrogenobacter sp. T-2]
MEWQTVLTVILSVITAHAVVLGLVAGLINKRIEDTNKRIDETNKRIDELKADVNRRFDKVEDEIREIRQLLYKFLEVPQKSGD